MSARAMRFDVPWGMEGEPTGGLVVDRTGALAMVEGPDAIGQSIAMILRTRRGERVMRPDFGCDLHEMVFAPMDGTSAGIAMHLARQAVARWEPRVKVMACEAGFDASGSHGSVLRIRIEYEIRTSGERGETVTELEI